VHFTKVVPSIFYVDIKIALKTFIDCLEFTMSHDELNADHPFCVVKKDGVSIMLFQNAEYAEKEHPEIRLVTDNIDEVYIKVFVKFPELLHPNLNEVTLRPWGAKEFALLDGQIGIRVQQWPDPNKPVQEYMLPYFGPVDLANLKERYHTVIAFPDHDYLIRLNLNFDNKQLEQKAADDIANFLSGLEELDKQNHLAIAEDFVNRQYETFDYIQFYLQELDEKELAKIVGKENDKTLIEKRLLQKLRLAHLALYPARNADSSHFAIFDYTIDIDGQPCNQVLAIQMDKDGTCIAMDWES
jgi:hypothetical protein